MTITFRAKTAQGWTIDSPLTPFIFPDGAAHIKGADSETEYQYQIADVRGLDHDDLFMLSVWSETCEQRGERKVLILPYLPGARMDRGVPNGAAVYGSYISTFVAPDQIITIDPHSPAALSHFFPLDGVKTTVFPFERIIKNEVQDGSSDSKKQPYAGVIAPDKGAVDRATRAAKVMGVPVYLAGKTRDFETGKLTGFHMEDELPSEGKFLLVDDICDGGGTFLGLADAIGLGPERLDLWVTHGVFSNQDNVLELFKRFGVIHTTDSYRSQSQNVAGAIEVGLLDGFFDDGLGSPARRFKTHKLLPYLTEAINV